MKKILCAMLSVLLVCSLLACSGGDTPATTTASAETPVLRAGYGRAAFTPKNTVKLTNKAQSNFSAVYEDVYITCIALTDAQEDTVLLFTCDMIRCPDNIRTTLLRAASEATGVPEENMIFSVTTITMAPALPPFPRS